MVVGGIIPPAGIDTPHAMQAHRHSITHTHTHMQNDDETHKCFGYI